MARERRSALQLIFIFASALMVAALASAKAQDATSSPNMSGGGSSHFAQTPPAEKSASPPSQDNESTKWMSLPRVPFIDLYWDRVGTDLGTGIAGDSFKKNLSAPPSASEAAKTNSSSWFANSQLGIQTQKKLQAPWRTDCASDEECADYSGLPKSESSKRTLKNLRKPFFGLSITTPLQ